MDFPERERIEQVLINFWVFNGGQGSPLGKTFAYKAISDIIKHKED